MMFSKDDVKNNYKDVLDRFGEKLYENMSLLKDEAGGLVAAKEATLDAFPLLQKAMHSRLESFKGTSGARPAANANEYLGAIVLGKIGFTTKRIKREMREGRAGVNKKRGGFSGKYQEMADKFDILPPDEMLAMASGLTTAGIQSSRRFARDDGYVLEPFKINGVHQKFWHVTCRPVTEDKRIRAAADLLGCSYEKAAKLSDLFKA